MRRTLHVLNLVATALTLASALAVLAQDLFVPGYRAYYRDALWFVVAYGALHALTLVQLARRGALVPWLVAARTAAAYVFLLNLPSLWPQWRYWTPARYVYQLVDIPGVINIGLLALLYLGRGTFNTLSLLTFTDQWWRPLRRSHPFAGRLVTAAFTAGVVFTVWKFLAVITQEAKIYSPMAEFVAREVLRDVHCEAVQENLGRTTTDLRRRGDTHYRVEIAYDCAVTRVVVRTEDGRVGSTDGPTGSCCARGG